MANLSFFLDDYKPGNRKIHDALDLLLQLIHEHLVLPKIGVPIDTSSSMQGRSVSHLLDKVFSEHRKEEVVAYWSFDAECRKLTSEEFWALCSDPRVFRGSSTEFKRAIIEIADSGAKLSELVVITDGEFPEQERVEGMRLLEKKGIRSALYIVS